MNSLKDIKEIIINKDHFIIMGHIDPDGDCIGSVFALKWALDRLGKKSLVLLNDLPEKVYHYLQISPTDYNIFKDFNTKKYKWPEYNMIALDSGDIERLGGGIKLTKNRLLINIDHHVDNTKYGQVNYINPEMSATGEIIYDLLSLLKVPIDIKIGKALATAIIADTGGFRYQNTSARVMRVIASLMDIGVDSYKINKALFGTYSYSAIKLKGLALSTLQLGADGKIAWLKVDQDMLKRVRTEISDASGLVNYARDIADVEVGIAFYEIDSNKTKVSFRSNNYCPVHEIAAYFGGGGHPRAAGCKLNRPIAESIELILRKVEEYV